ncbi:MAG: DUF1189 domain-containing protein [bacterium]|nr:DUF1189 domain-containing protein [bacterium]
MFKKTGAKFISTFLHSLYPLKYKQLSNRGIKDAFAYFFIMLFVFSIIALLISLPALFTLGSHLNAQLSKFETLSIDVDIETKEPVVFDRLGVVVDSTGQTEYEGNKILITKEELIGKPVLCLLYKPMCLISGEEIRAPTSQWENVLENQDSSTRLVQSLMIVALPALFVVLYCFFALKYLILMLLFSIIGFVITRILLFETHFVRIFKIALYSTTIMALIEIINLSFGYKLYGAPLILFAIVFIIGLFMIIHKKGARDMHG